MSKRLTTVVCVFSILALPSAVLAGGHLRFGSYSYDGGDGWGASDPDDWQSWEIGSRSGFLDLDYFLLGLDVGLTYADENSVAIYGIPAYLVAQFQYRADVVTPFAGAGLGFHTVFVEPDVGDSDVDAPLGLTAFTGVGFGAKNGTKFLLQIQYRTATAELDTGAGAYDLDLDGIGLYIGIMR